MSKGMTNVHKGVVREMLFSVSFQPDTLSQSKNIYNFESCWNFIMSIQFISPRFLGLHSGTRSMYSNIIFVSQSCFT